jgi:hypothetical protein
MAPERNREQMPVPDDDGNFPFEVWKDGELHKACTTFDEAKGICDRGNKQAGKFEVHHEGKKVWPL